MWEKNVELNEMEWNGMLGIEYLMNDKQMDMDDEVVVGVVVDLKASADLQVHNGAPHLHTHTFLKD